MFEAGEVGLTPDYQLIEFRNTFEAALMRAHYARLSLFRSVRNSGASCRGLIANH